MTNSLMYPFNQCGLDRPIGTTYSAGRFNNARYQYSLRRNLYRAIANDEFDLLYQPQVHISSNRIVGVEALLRWNSEEFGLISPTDFIPVAEKMGLISELDNLVIEKACEQAANWRRNYAIKIRVAVNVSCIQLQNYKIIEFVKLCLNKYKLSKNMLEIELTESSLIHDKNIVINVLNQLRGMGVRTAIDDFGTGYSSLSYLASMPFDLIKIDKVFIDGHGNSFSNNKVLMSIIQLGKKLGMEVLAEGVETKLQYKTLTRNKCDFVQGFLICKPVRAEKIPDLIAARNKRKSTEINRWKKGEIYGI